MALKFIDTYNTIVGACVTILAALLGEYWFLFVFFLLFNAIDWLTGWHKARKLGEESSKVGLKGIIKKLGYWAIVVVAFAIPIVFIAIGDKIGIDLGVTELIGWFTLASLLINELRSILENLVETGYDVPTILIKGLAVTEKLVQSGFKDDDVS